MAQDNPDVNPDDMMEQQDNDLQEESLFNTIAEKAPWWVASFVLHALLIVVSLFWYVGMRSITDDNVIISTPRQIPPEIEEKEKDIQLKDVNLEQKVEEPLLTERQEERNESPSDQPFEQMEGENLDNISDKPMKGKWANDVIGAGGGAGGAYGGRGGLLALRQGGGGGTGKRQAVLNALRWLMRHQNSDGSWDVKEHTKNCGKHPKFPGLCDNKGRGVAAYKVGITGLSVLAFTGAGFTHISRDKDPETGLIYGETVKKAIEYLIRNQDENGCFGERNGEYMYNHLIATFAFCEDYFFTGSPMLKETARKAVEFCVNAQTPNAGIRYEYQSGTSDSSVSGWLAQAYKSAEMCGLEVPQQNKDGILNWYNSVTDQGYQWVGYREKVNDPVVMQGENDQYRFYPALTAIALMTRIFFGQEKSDKNVTGHARYIKSSDANLPKWEEDIDADFYYWYYSSYAMWQMGGDYWKWWEKPIEKVMLEHQSNKQDCTKGSWDPVDKWSWAGGRVYTTATGALILEVYYRFPNVFQQHRK
ncbi:MAG: hypothetical protein HY606_04710 [Planctomycetes bacterium]|nr:hypothetical protein [Planctomycetota bacterium]